MSRILASNTLIINDFENNSSQGNWEGSGTISGKFPAHGNKCLELVNSREKSSWFEIKSFPHDWSGYELLKFDIYNPSDQLYYGNIQIFDKLGSDEQAEFQGQSYNGEKLFVNTGWTHFEFLLRQATVEEGNRSLALNQIRKLRLSFGHPNNSLFVDNIRLVKGQEGRKTSSKSEPNDCKVVIDNRYVYPSLAGAPVQIKTSQEILRLRNTAKKARAKLKNEISLAQLQGFQTLYQQIPLITSEIGMGIRSKLVWFQNEKEEKKILEYVISSCSQASDEINDLISARQSNLPNVEPENDVANASFYVPPYPPLKDLKPTDGFYRDKSGNPVLILSMLQINDGPLMDYFAPFNHRIESYTVGGGSRYNIENSPVYEAFHKYPDTHRVGWDGWCGHLIKDRWAMGGKKEDVVICLENQHIREAILEYMKIHYKEWINNPNLLYNIMAYELQYICYCDNSQQMYREWLKSNYNNIQVLNQAWKTTYSTFNGISAPETKNARPVEGTNRAEWYDWANFNTYRFTHYLKWIKDEMLKLDPNTPICAGGTSSMLSSSNSVTGIDEEMIINQVDDIILNESGESPIFSDLFLSLSDHKKVMADPEMGGGPHGILLQFLHGKSDISKWWWPGSPSKEYPQLNETSIPHGKQISLSDIDEVLRVGLDIRRLSSEIAEFTKDAPEVAILYSKTSILQVPSQEIQSGSTPYITTLRSVWESARFLGCRTGFVSEDQILAGKLSQLKLLIIPAVKYIKPEIVLAVKKYSENGGIVLVIPESFMFDQYAHEFGGIKDMGINVNGVTLPPVTGQADKVQNYDQSFSQAIQYGEVHKNIICLNTDVFTGISALTLHSEGLFQTINPEKNTVLAKFEDGLPALVQVKMGKGSLYYLAAPLITTDYLQLLAPLAQKAGVRRPVVGIGNDGSLLTGIEVRAVEREKDFLVYTCNLASDSVEFELKGEKEFGQILDLRTLTRMKSPHISLRPFQETIYIIEKK